ncbi:MAG: protein kinase, partial [Chitinivibrionales bacterium]|nr:protein kinase [Chitinivibrionales bacterium]
DILQGAWIRWGGGVWEGLNWALVLLLFPGLAVIVPGDKKLLAMVAGVVLFGASIGVSVALFGRMGYFWNPANHLYAWVFSLLWLAAVRANPVLAESAAPVMAEPPAQDESDIRPPPSKEQYLRAIPRNDTATFVIRKLVPEAATGQQVRISAQVFEQFRTLSGGTIIQTLGSGGMADVYLIWNPRLEVYRAVKVIKPGQNPQLMERFETEIRIFSKLNHPNIVVCYGVGEWHGLPTVEMEYVHGTALESIQRKRGRLTPPQVLALGILTCRALHYAHNQVLTIYGKTYHGVIHRDIKPANIMLSRSGRIKLTDFGIARPGETSIHTGDAGHVVGTLPYLAPEQLDEDADLTARTDLYALGATLYELLTGSRAFPQRDVTSLIKAKTFGSIPPLKTDGGLPQRLVDTINRAMATEPQDRHENALVLCKELEKCMRELDVADGYAELKQLVDEHFSQTGEAA